ncbi:hypothetical protein CDAR_88581 [Caerostris darwini]|uniref:Uncharacterized protein n=1 Tax=Caerostris darwini TaxID=1538125 RepID=A0AAV4NGA4_9ARAC|nr:hypothetical protein CDAR_88581 [Caerostris darwini]
MQSDQLNKKLASELKLLSSKFVNIHQTERFRRILNQEFIAQKSSIYQSSYSDPIHKDPIRVSAKEDFNFVADGDPFLDIDLDAKKKDPELRPPHLENGRNHRLSFSTIRELSLQW